MIGEWSHQKRKGYHRIRVARVSSHGHRLWSVVVCVDTATWRLSGWVFKKIKVWFSGYFFYKKKSWVWKKLRSRHLFYYYFLRENKTRNKNPFFFIWLTQWIRKTVYIHQGQVRRSNYVVGRYEAPTHAQYVYWSLLNK